MHVTGWHVQIHLRIPLDAPGQDRTVLPLHRQDHDACQAKTVCVPLVVTSGESYRMREARSTQGGHQNKS